MTEQTPDLVAETARLQLRPVRPGDEQAVYALLSDARVVRTTRFPVFAREQQAAEFIARVQQQLASAQPARLAFGMVDRAGRDLVGLCGLVFKPELQDAEVWYLLRPDQWGRGLVTEAVRALVDHAFGAYALHRVWATCLPENGASVRVLEKLGFRREGLFKQHLPIGGVWRDTYVYAVLADEWTAGAAQRTAA